MSPFTVKRPVVRAFKSRFVSEISTHVRAGGHTVVWDSDKRARLVLPIPDASDSMDLAYWSMLDLDKKRWQVIPRGTLRGLATTLVPRDCLEIVRRRAERDSAFSGSTHVMTLDCLACGACCQKNRVILDDDDIERFIAGGRPDLLRPPFTKKSDGKLVLKLLRSKRCRHLEIDNKCAIYALRPDACSMFPAGSESCMAAREEELGIVDGVSAN